MLTARDFAAEVDAGLDDLLVLLEGNVATHHVEEQDSQRPDGGRPTVVAVEADPLGRAVHARTWRRQEERQRKYR